MNKRSVGSIVVKNDRVKIFDFKFGSSKCVLNGDVDFFNLR